MADRICIPWLHDRHSHASLYASLLDCVNLAGLTTPEVLQMLRGLEPDRLSVVFGWHSALAPLAPADLKGLPPVVIVNLSMHGFALTDAAVPYLLPDQAMLVAHRQDPAWAERNLPLLLAFFSRTARLTPAKFAAQMEKLGQVGLSVADEMLLPDEEALRIIQASPWGAHMACWVTPETYATLSPGAQGAVAGLKFFTDGALGSRTAALQGCYRDGSQGLLVYSDESLESCLADGHGAGKPLAIHAIGDRAIGQVLDTLERLDRNGLRFPSVRLEHVQFMDEGQARRARDLGLILSMQPNFNSDSRDYLDRLDADLLSRNNPFRMLIDRVGFQPGRDLIFGSDGMPHGVAYALQWSLFPWHDGQRLTVEEVVAGYGTIPGESRRVTLTMDEDRKRVTCALEG